jgi:hypothetical protein
MGLAGLLMTVLGIVLYAFYSRQQRTVMGR